MFFDTVKQGKPVKFAGGTTQTYLRKAQLNVMTLMQPILEKCERENLVLVNRYTPSQRLTPTQLVAEWRKGGYIWGPICWRLEKAEGLANG